MSPVEPSPRPSARRPLLSEGTRRHGPLILLLLLTCAAYAGLLHAGFVWDDEALVVRNSMTTDLANIPLFFTIDLWDGAPVEQGVSGYYRPLVLVSFAVDRALFGLWAPGHHLHSLAWHLLAVALLHGLQRRLVGRWVALAGAAVFALHPAQSEAVAWVSARNDPMAAALGLGALLCVLPRDAGGGRLVAGGLLAWAALMAKESVVLLPVLLLVLDLVDGRPGPLRRYLPLVAGVAFGIAQRLFFGVAGAAMPPAEGWHLLGDRALEVVGVYGAGLSVAWPLSGVRSLEWLPDEPTWRTAAGIATVLLLLLAPWLRRGRPRRLALAGLAWLLLAVGPTLIPVADKGVIGERYLYLGMVGLGLWLAGVLRGLALPAVGLAVLPWLLILHDRLPDWASDLSLWEAAVQDTPSPYATSGLGHIWMIRGHPEIALPLFVQAMDSDPPALDGCVAVMQAGAALGRVGHAERLGRWGLSRGCPRTGEHLGLLAALQAQWGEWERARRTLEGAPPDPAGRDRVVRAALARREGDLQAYGRELAAWKGAVPLDEQVEALLASARDTEPSSEEAATP